MNKIHKIPVKGQGVVELECFGHPHCPGCVLERAERALNGTTTPEDIEHGKMMSQRLTPEQVAGFDKKWSDKKLIHH